MERLTDIRVRPATIDDAEFLVCGNAQLAFETEDLSLDIDRLRGGVHAIFEDPARGFYLIAEADGKRAGQMLITYEWSDWRNGMFWWIQSVYAVPELRRRGVFRALYVEAERLAQQRGTVCGLRLYVDTHNRPAQEVYRRCGMHKTAYRLFEIDYVVRPPKG